MKLSEVELARLGDHNWNRSDFVKEIRVRLKKAGLKYCPRCAQVLPVEDFSSGQWYCNPCVAERSLKYYHENRTEVTERRSLYRQVTRDAINAIDDNAPEPDPEDLLGDDFFDDDFEDN